MSFKPRDRVSHNFPKWVFSTGYIVERHSINPTTRKILYEVLYRSRNHNKWKIGFFYEHNINNCSDYSFRIEDLL